MKCKICSSESSFFAKGAILNKYDVAYYCCEHCGFVQTEEPYWLQEAYVEPINRSDVGMVSRNINLSSKTKSILCSFFDRDEKFIDYGGGYGLLVRMMRDLGFDFYRYDSHCENIFANDFDADMGKEAQYELLTAFEVFEHLSNPLPEIERMLSLSSNILFTTELIPRELPKPGSWWYYGPEHGQHISLYSVHSLAVIASKHQLNIYSDGRALHLLTKRKLSSVMFKMVSRQKVARLLNGLYRQKSLQQEDYRRSLDSKRLS